MLDTRPQFDERDAEIRKARLAQWNSIKGPRVGDYCILKDGTTRRFTHDWGDGIQTTTANAAQFGASFYFGDGYCDFSGGLDPALPKSGFEDTGETADGQVWFFHHNQARAHNGVHTTIPCRVYRQV